MNARRVAACAVLAVAFGGEARAEACDAAAVLARARLAYPVSGSATLEVSSTLTLEASAGRAKPEKKRFVERYRFPDSARFEYHGPVSILVMGKTGARAWRVTNEGPVPAANAHFEIPTRIRSPGWFLASLSDQGAACVPGGQDGASRIVVTRGESEMVLLDIDEDGLIRRYEGESAATGKADVIRVDLADWRRVDGQWVAFRVTTTVNGKPYADARAESARAGVDILPEFFLPPPAGTHPSKEL